MIWGSQVATLSYPTGGALRAVALGCSQEGIKCPRCIHKAVSTRHPPPRGTLVPRLFKVLIESPVPCSCSGGRGHELKKKKFPIEEESLTIKQNECKNKG